MNLDADAVSPVVNRIKRAHGQLAGVLRMIEEGRDLEDVVNQLKATSRALDRAGKELVADELRRSIATDEQSADVRQLVEVLVALA